MHSFKILLFWYFSIECMFSINAIHVTSILLNIVETKNCLVVFHARTKLTRKIWHFLSKSFDIENYFIIRKCSLKQRSLLHNDISQSLHLYTILKSRRRRWLRIKLLRENFCNDFVIRFVLICLHWVWLHIIQYLFLLSSFCIVSCFYTKVL